MYTDTLCNSITATRNSVIKRTSNSRQSFHAPGSAGLLTSSLHLHEAVDMLLYILGKENKRKLGYERCTCTTVQCIFNNYSMSVRWM